MNLFAFGLGYSVLHLVERFRDRIGSVAGTVTTGDKAAALRANGVAAHVLDADDSPTLDEAAARDLAGSDAVLVSVPPPHDAPIARLVAGARFPGRPPILGYYSTPGVYGDRGGATVDATHPPAPTQARGQARLDAELRWREVAAGIGAPLAVFRIAGIYGPGRNALADLAAGRARRIVKPGQVFNRIHVDDIAAMTFAGLARGRDGVYDLADDEPAPPQDVVTHAAHLLGVPPPPEVLFADAAFSPMARSFWDENKRIDNGATKAALELSTLIRPTYREGLAALLAAGEGRGAEPRRSG